MVEKDDLTTEQEKKTNEIKELDLEIQLEGHWLWWEE